MPAAKKTYSFKSVGQLEETVDNIIKETAVNLPIGLLTPLSFSPTGNSMFRMSTDIGEQIKDNLRNLLSTNKGERLMIADFGTNLKELAYDISTEETDSIAIKRIADSVGRYMPFVELNTFVPNLQRSPAGDVVLSTITIGYDVPGAGITGELLEIALVVTS